MKYTLKNKTIQLTDEEVSEIVKQNQKPIEEKKVEIHIKNRFTGDIIFSSTKTTYKEVLGEAVSKNANLIGANLGGANLIGANLRDANLEYANLEYANLRGANLRDANLRDANLEYANLEDANLIGANLEDANLIGADFFKAKFFGIGGSTRISKSQVDDFFKALGVIVE